MVFIKNHTQPKYTRNDV